jgi:hypothetical protein
VLPRMAKGLGNDASALNIEMTQLLVDAGRAMGSASPRQWEHSGAPGRQPPASPVAPSGATQLSAGAAPYAYASIWTG